MSSEQQRPQVPTDMNAFNARLIEEFRANHGQLSGQMAGRRVLILTTRGARSGKERVAVIGYRPYKDGLAVIASANGAPKSPAWFHNLQADPHATVEVGPDKYEVTARVVDDPAERAEIAKKIDYLEPQQAKTSREIPVLVLERA
jgi:deazaflavin-dependent oxidoreductase (nitroreductase family)